MAVWIVACIILVTAVAFFNNPENLFLPTLFKVAYNAVYLIAIVLVVWYVFYFPTIWLLRKVWKYISVHRRFANTQTLKIISRYVSNTGAMFGTVTLLYAFLIFITAHIIAPDPTPNAGFQVNEIAFKSPGFHVDVLKVPLDIPYKKTGLLQWMIAGKELPYSLIPVQQYWVLNDTLFVQRFADNTSGVNRLSIPVQKIIPGYTGDDPFGEIQHNCISTKYYWLGTDDLGRDYLSRMLLGVRVSLAVGCIAVIIALLIGIPVGAAAGFYKKEPPQVQILKRKILFRVDNLLMWFMSVIWAIPALLLVFPIVFAFGQQFYTIFIAVGLTMWVDIARLVRGQVLQVREMEYITAAKNFGYSNFRTVFLHILPNITGPVIIITAANFAYAILTEAGLSFLGIGVQPPAPSWGLMISKYKDNLITDPYLALIPGAAITLLVLAFFMIGNGLRDAMDIKTQVGNT